MFSTPSPANSLPVHGTPLRQNKSFLGPKKASVQFFEIFPLSELVFTYDKLNFYTHTHTKKKTSVIDTLSPNFEL